MSVDELTVTIALEAVEDAGCRIGQRWEQLGAFGQEVGIEFMSPGLERATMRRVIERVLRHLEKRRRDD